MALASLSHLGCLLGLSQLDGRVTTAALLVLPFLITYAFTSIQAFRLATASSKQGPRRPPPAPYAVPGLAHTYQFATNTESFVKKLLKRFGQTPFGMLVGPDAFMYVPHGDMVLAMFKNSRDLTAKPLTLTSLRGMFGMSKEDIAPIVRDDSGINAKPLPGSEHMDPAHRIFYTQHRDLHNLLAGTALDDMTARFVELYSARLRTNPTIGETQWAEFPDLYDFLRNEMFQAATKALTGEHLLRLSPNFAQDFWEYDSYMMTFLRRLPRWLKPKAYRARDRTLEAFKKWREYAVAHADVKDEKLANVEWDPIWGARLMRVRETMFNDSDMTANARASQELGMLWATNANVIPATLWALLNVYLVPGLAERVLAETTACYDEKTKSFDIAALCSKPLLTSIYLEALRLSVATVIARNLLVPSLELGGWKFERGSTLMTIAWFGARDTEFWNQGRTLESTGEPEHPVGSFWAERFLEYPDDPASGPIRKADKVYLSADPRPKTIEDDKQAKVVTSGIQGHWYPYGGGTKICPGRFFAKQEMMAAVAVLMSEFEVELLDVEAAKQTGPQMNYFPSGALPPDRAVPVRMRRRT